MNDVSHILISSAKAEIQNIIGAERGPFLKKNEIVEGRVLDSSSPQNAVLLIKGKKVVVKTLFPLQKGNVSLFKVEQVAPQTILKLVGLHGSVKEGLVSLLTTTSGSSSPYKSLVKLFNLLASSSLSATDSEIISIISDIKTLLTRIALKSSNTYDPNFVKTLIDGSGLTWEHKLKQLMLNKTISRNDINMLMKGDLKGMTTKLLQVWKAFDAVPKEEIQRFVDVLEQLQVLNHTALAEKGKLFFQFPIQLNDLFSFGQLLIGLPKKGEKDNTKEDGDDIIRVSFLLQMSNIGPLRADMSILDKTIRGRFLVADPQIQSFINKHIPELKARFLRLGFLVHDFVCAMEEIKVLEGASLVEELIGRDERFFSLVV
ncbi:MAG: hypothetical protein JRE23_05565 [Deltaproteobacteria bacterium]|nr:hypothetical protein [Deltaproteobacteria bacterium]